MHKLQLKLQFPPLKPWFKCLRLPQLMLRIHSKIRLLCRYNFCSFYCLVFPWLVFALSPFSPLFVHVAACLYRFFDSFRPLVFYFVFCSLMFCLGRFGRFARFLSRFAHLLFVTSVCFASQTRGLCRAFLFGSLLSCTCLFCYLSVLRLANTGFV